MEDKESSIGGQLVLTYDQARDALQQWVVIDGKGRRTTVTLENVVTGEKPDPKLFVVKFKPKNTGQQQLGRLPGFVAHAKAAACP